MGSSAKAQKVTDGQKKFLKHVCAGAIPGRTGPKKFLKGWTLRKNVLNSKSPTLTFDAQRCLSSVEVRVLGSTRHLIYEKVGRFSSPVSRGAEWNHKTKRKKDVPSKRIWSW